MAIELSAEARRTLTDSIKQFFRDERGEEIGDLHASFLLDVVVREAAPFIYNRAVRDVQAHLHATVSNLDMTLFEPEPGRR